MSKLTTSSDIGAFLASTAGAVQLQGVENISLNNGSAIREAGYQGIELECSVGYKWQWVAGRMIMRQPSNFGQNTYEAENGILNGTANIENDGQYVGNLGNGIDNWVEIENVFAPITSVYRITVYYASGDDTRALSLMIDGDEGTLVTKNVPSTGGWNTTGSITYNVLIGSGYHTIRLYNANTSGNTYAPPVDKITVEQIGAIYRVIAVDGITPAASNDITQDFVNGSIWEMADGTTFRCVNATEGAAVWEPWIIPYGIDAPYDGSLNARQQGAWTSFGQVDFYNNITQETNVILTTRISSHWSVANAFTDSFGVEVYPGVAVDQYAFADVATLQSFSMYGQRDIYNQTFMGCTGLTNLYVESSYLGNYAFASCSNLFDAYIGNPTYIGMAAFLDCSSLESINTGGNATYIGPLAFQSCSSLTDVYFSPVLTVIDYQAFSGCSSLSMLTLPESLEQIGDNAFSSSGIIDLVLPASVATIGENAFANCPITNVSCYRLTPPTTTGNIFNGSIIATSINVPIGADMMLWGSQFQGLTVVNNL